MSQFLSKGQQVAARLNSMHGKDLSHPLFNKLNKVLPDMGLFDQYHYVKNFATGGTLYDSARGASMTERTGGYTHRNADGTFDYSTIGPAIYMKAFKQSMPELANVDFEVVGKSTRELLADRQNYNSEYGLSPAYQQQYTEIGRAHV